MNQSNHSLTCLLGLSITQLIIQPINQLTHLLTHSFGPSLTHPLEFYHAFGDVFDQAFLFLCRQVGGQRGALDFCQPPSCPVLGTRGGRRGLYFPRGEVCCTDDLMYPVVATRLFVSEMNQRRTRGFAPNCQIERQQQG